MVKETGKLAMMSVAVSTSGGELDVGVPQELFRGLMVQSDAPRPTEIQVVINFFGELRRGAGILNPSGAGRADRWRWRATTWSSSKRANGPRRNRSSCSDGTAYPDPLHNGLP